MAAYEKKTYTTQNFHVGYLTEPFLWKKNLEIMQIPFMKVLEPSPSDAKLLHVYYIAVFSKTMLKHMGKWRFIVKYEIRILAPIGPSVDDKNLKHWS